MGNKYESGFGIEMKTEETGLVELIVKIPHLTPENAKTIVRDARRAYYMTLLGHSRKGASKEKLASR